MEREGVAVAIHHEVFGSISVAVTVTTRELKSDGTARRESFGLHHLLLVDRPVGEIDLGPARLRLEDGSLASSLERHAELLRRHGQDLLEGDIARVPELRRVRAEDVRRRNKEAFGTSTGESPRFKERPSLEALFEDATNEGIREARAYQAYWDYEYNLAEIAAFLDVNESVVQAMLNNWDGIPSSQTTPT
jgi:hypothetical protein